MLPSLSYEAEPSNWQTAPAQLLLKVATGWPGKIWPKVG